MWKRKDVAILLLGLFVEDIQMYCIRNQSFNIFRLIEDIVMINFDQAPELGAYLQGRALWCLSTCNDCFVVPSEQVETLKRKVLSLSIQILSKEIKKSIKLIAARTLVRFSRKLSKEVLNEYSEQFQTVLGDLLMILDSSQRDLMHLPVEAFLTFSKVNEKIVAAMAPIITPKLLTIFKTEHSEGSLGQELMNLFKVWCLYDQCRDIFINTFIPFILEIIEAYFKATLVESKPTLGVSDPISESISLESSNEKPR